MSPAFDVSKNLQRTASPSKSESAQSTDKFETTAPVPTFVDKTPKTMDITGLDSFELARLKRDDPFLYYSIPTAANAALHGTDVDLASLVPCVTAETSTAGQTTVTRKSRVTTEGHSNLLWEEILGLSTRGMWTMHDETDEEADDDFYLELDLAQGYESLMADDGMLWHEGNETKHNRQ